MPNPCLGIWVPEVLRHSHLEVCTCRKRYYRVSDFSNAFHLVSIEIFLLWQRLNKQQKPNNTQEQLDKFVMRQEGAAGCHQEVWDFRNKCGSVLKENRTRPQNTRCNLTALSEEMITQLPPEQEPNGVQLRVGMAPQRQQRIYQDVPC
jgi:hypothetical protein